MGWLLMRLCQDAIIAAECSPVQMRNRRPSAQNAPGYQHVRTLLLEMREKAGLTQGQLGERLKMDQTLIHRSESGGRRVTPLEFAQWARACGVEPAAAMGDLAKRAGV